MSVQAMTWALAIPKATLENPAARHVLLCLANYAGSDGRGAFPSAGTLSDDTGLSERTVRLKLDELCQAGWIAEGNQAIAAAYIDRCDRRPVVYDLQMKRGASAAPRAERGAANRRTGCSSCTQSVIKPIYSLSARAVRNVPRLAAQRRAVEGVCHSSRADPRTLRRNRDFWIRPASRCQRPGSDREAVAGGAGQLGQGRSRTCCPSTSCSAWPTVSCRLRR